MTSTPTERRASGRASRCTRRSGSIGRPEESVDQQRTGRDRIDVGASYDDAVLGFDTTDLGDGHTSPYTGYRSEVLAGGRPLDGPPATEIVGVLALLDEGSDEDDSFALLAGDLRPVVRVRRVR